MPCKLTKLSSAQEQAQRATMIQQERRDARRQKVQAFLLPPDLDRDAEQRLRFLHVERTFATNSAAVQAMPPERRAMIGAGSSGKWGYKT